MHIKLRHSIGKGDCYFVAFPRWPGVYDWHLPATEHWNETTVLKINPPREDYSEAFHLQRVEKLPLGTTALVLLNPGEGPEAEMASGWYSNDPEGSFVKCLVTPPDKDSFTALVGVTELWTEDPREEKHAPEWPMPKYDLGPKDGYPELIEGCPEKNMGEVEVEVEKEEVKEEDPIVRLWNQKAETARFKSLVWEWYYQCVHEGKQEQAAILLAELKKK